MSQVTEKTQANSRVEAHRLHGALVGLAARFEANELDPAPVRKAAKALEGLAKDVQDGLDAARAAKAEYHASVGPAQGADSEKEALRQRVAELEAQLGR